jgi:hypothetical protein
LSFSQLESDLNCLLVLHTNCKDWTHVLNFAGSELPIHPVSHIERFVEQKLVGEKSYVQSYPVLPEEKIFKDKFQFQHALMASKT